MADGNGDFWAQVLGATVGAVLTAGAAVGYSLYQRNADRRQRKLDAQDLGHVVVDSLRDFTDETQSLLTALDGAKEFSDGSRTPRLTTEEGMAYGLAHASVTPRLPLAQGYVSDFMATSASGLGRNRTALVQRLRVELDMLKDDLAAAALAPYPDDGDHPRYFAYDDGPRRLRKRWGTVDVLLREITKLDPAPLRQVLPR